MASGTDVVGTVARQLDLLSRTSLKTVAYLLGTGLALGERSSEIEPLASRIGTPVHRELLERYLTPRDWALLNLLPLQIGPFQVRALLSPLRREGLRAREAFDAVAKLLACAALLPVSTSRHQAKLNIDAAQIQNWARGAWLERSPGVAEWARERDVRQVPLQPAEPPADVAQAALAEFRRVAFLLVAEAKRKPIRLTVAGAPNRTDLRRIAALLGNHGGEAAKPESRPAPIPELLYLALAVLISARLLRAESSGLRPAANTGEFFTGSAESQATSLFHGWSMSDFDDFACIPTLSRAYGGGDGPWLREDRTYIEPTDVQINTARAAVVEAIARLVGSQPDAWYRIGDVAEFIGDQYPELLYSPFEPYGLLYDVDTLERLGQTPRPRRAYPGIYRRPDPQTGNAGRNTGQLYQDSDWMEVEGAFIRQVLAGAMRHLGLTEVGPGSTTPDRFRLTDLGQSVLLGKPLAPVETAPAGRVAIVQPNFEVVVVDAAANFGLLAQLDAFAERRRLDRAATYQLTQAALVRGLDQGWSGERVLDALETANDGPLPQNVRYSLEQWLELYESVTLRENATVIEVDLPEQLDRMLADPQLSPVLGSRIGAMTALIASQHLELVTSAALEAGGLREIDYSLPLAGAIRVLEPDRIELRDQASEPYVRYRLGVIGETTGGRGHGQVYRMTPEAVARAVDSGWTGQQLAAFLAAAAGEELPVEFLVRLLGWSRAVPPLATEALVAVRLPDSSLDWDALRAIPALASLVRVLLSPSLALVSAPDLESLRAELSHRGLSLQEATLPDAALTPVIPMSVVQAALDRYWEGPHAIRRTLHSFGVVGKARPRRRGED